jgi:hypothetical protein
MSGKIFLCHPWTLLIWHGGTKASPFTIGIEFDGNPEGIPGQYWKNPKLKKNGVILDKYKNQVGPHPISEQQVKASKVLLKLLRDEIVGGGGTFEYVLAHRQSSQDRVYDPGWECWQKIAIPWMNETGATYGDNMQNGGFVFVTELFQGAPIPKDWDPRSTRGWMDR